MHFCQLTLILLIATIVVFSLTFHLFAEWLLLGMECVSKQQDLQIFVLKLNKYSRSNH